MADSLLRKPQPEPTTSQPKKLLESLLEPTSKYRVFIELRVADFQKPTVYLQVKRRKTMAAIFWLLAYIFIIRPVLNEWLGKKA